jgi:hypothetical protein
VLCLGVAKAAHLTTMGKRKAWGETTQPRTVKFILEMLKDMLKRVFSHYLNQSFQT